MKSTTYIKQGTRHQHRINAEKMLGRELMPGEIVHHKDHNRHNNSPENLEIMTQSEHAKLHFTGTKRILRTHCKNGHPYDEISSIGRQVCSVCRKAYDNEWKKKQRRDRGLKRPGAKPGQYHKRDEGGKFA